VPKKNNNKAKLHLLHTTHTYTKKRLCRAISWKCVCINLISCFHLPFSFPYTKCSLHEFVEIFWFNEFSKSWNSLHKHGNKLTHAWKSPSLDNTLIMRWVEARGGESKRNSLSLSLSRTLHSQPNETLSSTSTFRLYFVFVDPIAQATKN